MKNLGTEESPPHYVPFMDFMVWITRMQGFSASAITNACVRLNIPGNSTIIQAWNSVAFYNEINLPCLKSTASLRVLGKLVYNEAMVV